MRDELQQVCDDLLPPWRLVEACFVDFRIAHRLVPFYKWPDVARLAHALELSGLPRELVCETVLTLYLATHLRDQDLVYVCR